MLNASSICVGWKLHWQDSTDTSVTTDWLGGNDLKNYLKNASLCHYMGDVKAVGSSCASLFIRGGEVNQMCICQTDQLILNLEIFSLVKP